MWRLPATICACVLAILHVRGLGADKPNIIVILTDDMGYSDLGCYGSEIPTPSLDGLASGGVRFTQFYNTGRCCPTRACLLTGLYPHQAGVGHMVEDRGREGYRGELNDHCVTIAEALRPSGYRTYALGKWHVSRNVRDSGSKAAWPLQRGFDRFYGTVAGGGNYFDPGSLTRDNRNISPFADPEYQPEHFYYTDAISDQAVRFISEHERDHSAAPFFMYVAYTAAHWPLHAPEEEIARFKGKYDAGYGPVHDARLARMKQMELVPAGIEPAALFGDWEKVEHKDWEARCMEVYAAQVARMDAGVGKIVAQLKRSGISENTVIFFMQDNGGCAEAIMRNTQDRRGERPTQPVLPLEAIRYEVRAKQTRDGYPVLGGPFVMPGPGDTFQSYGKAWANVSNTPFREYKHWVHEGGISTPLIVNWPAGIVKPGRLERQPGHLIDIHATCVHIAGGKYPQERAGIPTTPPEGTSLLPALKAESINRKVPIFWEHEGNRAVREGKWKLVAKGPGGAWELYDIDADRGEQHDLASSNPEKTADLIAKWEEYARRANVIPWIWKPPYGGKKTPDPASDTPEFDDTSPGSDAAKFTFHQGDDIPNAKAPRLVGKGFLVEVDVKEIAKNGVLIAQGGSAHGWVLFVDDGKLTFAIRRGGNLSAVAGPQLSKAGTVRLTVRRDGEVVVEAGGEKETGRIPGLLTRHPQDGLQVGRDTNGFVGRYRDESVFPGKIGGVSLEVVN